MSYSQHIYDQMPRKNEFKISIAVIHILGLLIYLELKIKSSFLRIIKKTFNSTIIFGYIFTNPIQPYQAANISEAFFLCRPMMKHYSCHKFLNKFQDDILSAFAINSYK